MRNDVRPTAATFAATIIKVKKEGDLESYLRDN